MRTIIAGCRTAMREQTFAAIEACPFKSKITVTLCGGAGGGDTWGRVWANSQGIPIEDHPAQWSRFGRRAGNIRNIEMARAADALIAVWDGQSPGTAHMIAIAQEYGLRVFVHRTDRKDGK